MRRSGNNKTFISFPPGLLGELPLRMPLIGETEDWIAVDKPAGVAMRQHPWNKVMPDMDSVLNQQLQAKKPELLESGATLFGSVYSVEPEVSGVALFAKHRDGLARLRNLAGSEKFRFKFTFVTKSGAAGCEGEWIADAPLMIHNVKPKMIPSTAKGKKTKTHFRLLNESDSGWALWEATTSFLRIHQVRAHAAVHGISILGDTLYSGPDIPQLSELMPQKRSSGIRPYVFNGIALHLSEVLMPVCGNEPEAVRLAAVLPDRFRLMLKRMQLDYSK